MDARVGWGFRPLDADYSPDQRWIVYSARSSPFFYLVSVNGDWQVHRHLSCDSQAQGLFSINFSTDSAEVVIGSGDYNAYIYDLNADRKVAQFEGHENDVNTAIFLDNVNT